MSAHKPDYASRDANESHLPKALSPSFEYPILVCQNFDGVLSGEGDRVSPSELTSIARSRGRILMQARGGAGKTETLKILERSAAEEQITVIQIDVIDVVSQAGPGVDGSAASVIVDSLSEQTSDGNDKLLLLDGLNEIPPDLAPAVIEAVDELAVRDLSVGTVVTDRLSRRHLSSRWGLATLGMVPNHIQQKFLGETHELCSIPFYLESARHTGRAWKIRSDTHKDFLLHHAVTEDELGRLSLGAFRQYELTSNRKLDPDEFIKSIGKATFDKLVTNRIVVDADSAPRFSHHLIHDYLAASYLAQHPDLWGPQGFDTITFRATSFDALAMVLEQIPTMVDAFLLRVYDWNFYASAYLLAEDRMGSSQVSGDLEVAILSLLAEKRFDRVAATAEQVSDALRAQPSAIAKELLRKPDIEAILETVRERVSGDSLKAWRDIFTRNVGAPMESCDVQVLQAEDALLGWTMAAVIRRSEVSNAHLKEIRRLLKLSHPPTVRWRTAHTLGAFPRQEVVDDLIACFLRDEEIWVRYGALRSLVEVAAEGSPELRKEVFDRMSRMQFIFIINQEERLQREAERAFLMREYPSDWPETAGMVIEQLWAASPSVEAQDRWRRLANGLKPV
ncbi:HEAT repeat domain-containing protein [Streptomyces sp. NPDC056938]|uniref:HEAT repeat domain-containing protein n=1 Tax=Streptomyces sp. NPDC056938 TaxID=3345970 RepID=UPI003635D90D